MDSKDVSLGNVSASELLLKRLKGCEMGSVPFSLRVSEVSRL